MEGHEGRLTVLLDRAVRESLNRLCAEQRTTASEVVRALVHGFVLRRSFNSADYTPVNIGSMGRTQAPREMTRLTVLIVPSTKTAFEEVCRSKDMTPSQVVRRLIRDWLTEHGVLTDPNSPGAKRSTKKKK